MSKCRIIGKIVNRVERDMVKGIKEFAANLGAESFADFEVFDQGDVPVVQPRPNQNPSSGRPKVPDGIRKGPGIEPFRYGSRTLEGNSCQTIGARCDGAGINAYPARVDARHARHFRGAIIDGAEGVVELENGDWSSLFKLCDTGNLPAPQCLAHKSVLVFEERQVIHVIGNEDLWGAIAGQSVIIRGIISVVRG